MSECRINLVTRHRHEYTSGKRPPAVRLDVIGTDFVGAKHGQVHMLVGHHGRFNPP